MSRSQLRIADVVSDPLAALARARSAGWLVDTEQGSAIVRYAEVRSLLSDPRFRASFTDFLRSFGIHSGPFFEWMAASPLNRDGDEHVRWRSVMSRTFTPRRVEGIRPFLRAAAHELIDAFAHRGTCEFMGEFADAYPSLGLCELIGVPLEDRDRFRGWANAIGLGFSPIDLLARIAEVDAALVQLLDYTGKLAEKRRVDPRDDLVTQIARAGHEAGWREDEMRGAIAGLVFAGHETTKNQLGWMIAVLAEHPEVWNAVAEGRLAAAAVVEEVLRLRSAVTGAGRSVAEPVEHDGERIEPGTSVFFSIWSANRDAVVFPQPDVLDTEANGHVPHLSFGHGAHHCLGAALARAELREALAALAERIECPSVGEGASWRPPVGINGPERLPIAFRPRR